MNRVLLRGFAMACVLLLAVPAGAKKPTKTDDWTVDAPAKGAPAKAAPFKGAVPAGTAKKVVKASGTEAVVATLMDDVDSLNTVAAGHTKEIGNLKQKVDDIEKKLGEGVSQAIGPVQKDVAELKTDVEAVKQDVVTLKSLLDKNNQLFWLTPTLEVRVRPEFQTNRTDMNVDNDDRNFVGNQRIRFGVEMEPRKGLKGKIVIQDSRQWGMENSVTSDAATHLDLHEGYILMSDLFTPGLSFQVGRMEMNYGAERQISRSNWHNVGRSFDGARLAYELPDAFKLDLFAMAVRHPGSVVGHDSGFYGIYGTANSWQYLKADWYLLYLDDSSGSLKVNGASVDAKSRIGTVGARLVSNPVDGLTLEAEASVQFGKVDVVDQAGAKEITASHLATAYFAQALYEFQVETAPTLGAFFQASSGDANPYDDRDVMYRPNFPAKHGVFGMQELFTWQGVMDVGPTLRISPIKDLLIRADFHYLFLTSDGGRIQAFDQVATFTSGHGKFPFVGQEYGILARWKAMDYFTLEGGYSLFKPGSEAQNATVPTVDAQGNAATRAIGSDLSHYVYLQATLAL